ncbi:site-specific integrase [Halorientalis regularis]|uniref:Phage integrase family protein n=1 Tax=Halorientalis regularis TaxID=660518 RepID=A0A1G7UD63_9EURY|nr:tyrosine-type recombinase/integrase [Halorientalis regularis]SDG45394.1 Phage integrase family protein [Halorientalis regularis]
MSKYGDLDFDDEWYDEPLERYLSHKQDVDDVTDVRFEEIQRAIADSPDDADWDAWDEVVDWRDGMTTDDARTFLSQLRRAGLGERTVENEMRIVQSFLKELLDREVVDSNPVAYVTDEATFDVDDKDKLDRSVDEIGAYLRGIPNLQFRGIGMTFAKTGIRLAENLNIDLPFIHLDHDIFYETLDRHGVSIHEEIADQPDTLYIPAEPTIGEVFRGEQRRSGNKRKRATRIPVDGELKRALLDWLAVRPETAHPHPLWTSPQSDPTRLSHKQVGKKLTNHFAEQTGLVDDGSTGAFTPHWFRHFFTTNMQPGRGYHDRSIAPTLVKYIRGDVGTATEGSGSDIMDVYSHDWGDQVRDEYLDNIYQFGIYD